MEVTLAKLNIIKWSNDLLVEMSINWSGCDHIVNRGFHGKQQTSRLTKSSKQSQSMKSKQAKFEAEHVKQAGRAARAEANLAGDSAGSAMVPVGAGLPTIPKKLLEGQPKV